MRLLSLPIAACAAALFLMSAPRPALAQETSDEVQTAQAPAEGAVAEPTAEQQQANERRQRRCRRETFTGSRLPARVCGTQQQFDEMEAEARTMLDRAQRLPLNENNWANPNGP